MAKKIITIDVDEQAETFSVKTENYNGVGCKAISDAFSAGATILTSKNTPEYYNNGGPGAGNCLGR